MGGPEAWFTFLGFRPELLIIWRQGPCIPLWARVGLSTLKTGATLQGRRSLHGLVSNTKRIGQASATDPAETKVTQRT